MIQKVAITHPCLARVLIVENDPRARSQLVEVLTRPGYIVRAAEGNGPVLQEEAKKLADSFRPHVVVMDLRLVDDEYSADRSGLELLKEKSFSSSRCVLHSAYLNIDFRVTREAFIEARVADVIGKEESPRRLIESVEKAARQDCICCREFSIVWPETWDEKKVIEVLFGKISVLPSDTVVDVLGHLFPDARSVRLEALKGAAQSSASIFRGRSVLFQAWTDNKEPFVVKLAPRDRTAKEVASYNEFIKDRLLGRFYAELQDHKIFWELGGICYSFMGSSQKAIDTFASFYQPQKSSAEIVKPLKHFFEQVWSKHYSNSQQPLNGSLYSGYDTFLKLSQRLDESQFQEEMLEFAGLPGLHINPIRWLRDHREESLILAAKQAITHGDLHGDNLFIEQEHAWAIDFERSRQGPILRDFVELEQDIVLRLIRLPAKNLRPLYDLATILCIPSDPKESFTFSRAQPEKEIYKSLEVIKELRSMAHKLTGYLDMREYYWGLLFVTVFTVLLAKKYSKKWWRGLLFGSVLCTRLSNWNVG